MDRRTFENHSVASPGMPWRATYSTSSSRSSVYTCSNIWRLSAAGAMGEDMTLLCKRLLAASRGKLAIAGAAHGEETGSI